MTPREQLIAQWVRQDELDYRIGWWLSRAVILLGLVLIAGAAAAATKHTVTYEWSLYKGTTKVKPIPGSSSDTAYAACMAELGRQTAAATYSCKTPVTSDVVTIIPDPPPPILGSATLTWTAPTQNIDGTSYSDAFGFVISYGTTPDLPQFIDVNDPNARSYIVQGLSAGTYYFCIRARNTSNVRSDCSTVVSKTL